MPTSQAGSKIHDPMPPALDRRLKYAGPALFSYGFRPFFLGGALWSVLGILLWVPQYMGHLSLPTAYPPVDWHIHEMLYGYVAAVVAGFLLTAIPNWTGRLPIRGVPLLALVSLWLAGRVAIAYSAYIGIPFAAAIDVAFLLALASAASREVVAGRNWRNLPVLILVAVLIAGNLVFHIEVYLWGSANYGIRIGIAAMILLVSLIGGRIVPSFTRNWLARQKPGRLPVPFSRFDVITIVVSFAALTIWVALPDSKSTGFALIATAFLQTIRFARWAGERTTSDRLVLVLHVGYLFVPLGFTLLGVSIFEPLTVPSSAGIHAWTAGAIGMMTLAVMTRASLGHIGQSLVASKGTQVVYACVLCAAVLRIISALTSSIGLMEIASVAWIVAFGGFAVLYGPLLARAPPA